MINKKYNIILCDPPWLYNNRRLIRKDGGKTRYGIGASGRYDCMSTQEIALLPVYELADDRCMLFLWTTMPRIPDAIDVMDMWGFEYKTVAFTWVKTTVKSGKYFFGTGYYTKSNPEICLLGTIGKPFKVSNKVSSLVVSPIEKPHSKKPDIVRDKIVELCGDIPRIELFARTCGEGWDATGLEYDGLDIRKLLAEYVDKSKNV